jgi:hypothetical protein
MAVVAADRFETESIVVAGEGDIASSEEVGEGVSTIGSGKLSAKLDWLPTDKRAKQSRATSRFKTLVRISPVLLSWQSLHGLEALAAK